MTGKQLNAQNAVIKTATVEIKALTVSGRQVTQAVFRQLREEPLIAEDGTLNGVPWGYVNFHPDKCENLRDQYQQLRRHWHIVWQRGEDLLRSRVFASIKFEDVANIEADSYLDAWILDWSKGMLRWPLNQKIEHLVSFTWDSANQDNRHVIVGEVSQRFSNQETGVSFWATCSTAAKKLIAAKYSFEQAAEKASEPLSRYFIRFDPEWMSTNPELGSLVQRALELDVKISIASGLRAHISGGADQDNLIARLRSDEKLIADLLKKVRKPEIDAAFAAERDLEKAINQLQDEIGYDGGREFSDFDADLVKQLRAERARRDRHREIRATLAQLDQLFIAT